MDHHLFTLILLIGYASTSSSRPTCCKWNVVTTEMSLKQTATMETCRVTLRELIELESNKITSESRPDCSSKELNFQFGVHYFSGDKTLYLEYSNLSSVVIKGTKNTTIKCSHRFYLELYDIVSLVIKTYGLISAPYATNMIMFEMPINHQN